MAVAPATTLNDAYALLNPRPLEFLPAAQIRQAFTVVQLRFEEQEWAFLDAAQVLFRMASALYEFGEAEGLLSQQGRWLKILKTLDEKLSGVAGLQAKDGAASLEVNAFFLKLRTDLKLSDARRRQFRAIGENQQSGAQEDDAAA